MATVGEEEKGKGQSTQPETKEEVRILANTQFSFIASSSSSCSAVIFNSVNIKTREQRTVISVKKEKKRKTSSQFNATNTGKYASRKQIFED